MTIQELLDRYEHNDYILDCLFGPDNEFDRLGCNSEVMPPIRPHRNPVAPLSQGGPLP